MKYITFIFLILIITSCEDFFETTLELEEPEFEPQLVLSAIFENVEYDRRVLLSETTGLNDNPREKVVDADIALGLPDGSTESFEPMANAPVDGYSHIVNTEQFLQNGTYSIKATAPDGRIVKATAEMPDPVNILSGVFIENGEKDEFGNDSDVIDITIQDNPNQENYYKVRIAGVKNTNSGQMNLDSNDPSISESSIYRSLIITDAQFNGEDYRLRFLINNNTNDIERFIISFSSITKDQYRFDKILESYRENKDNPFSTPVQLHTNMEGGLGIFAIENVVEYIVER